MGPNEVVAGSTDVEVKVRIMDETAGTPEQAVTSTNTPEFWYRRQGAAKVAITDSDLSALTDAHSDGGFLHIDDGVYRLDVPDAAFAFGADDVTIGGAVAGMIVYGPTIRLLDPIGGLFASQTVGATGNSTTTVHAPAWTYGDDEINGYVAVIYDDSEDEYHLVRVTDWVNSTKLATFTPALAASVEASTDLVALLGKFDDRAGDILLDTAEIGTAGAGLTAIPASVILNALGGISGTAQTGTLSTTVATTNLTGYADDELIGRTIIFTGGTAGGQSARITAYANTNGQVTYTTLATAPVNGDTFVIL